MADSSICGAICVNCCYTGLFQWCSETRPGSGRAQKQSGCFPRGCGGMDDEDAFDRAEREDRERKAKLKAEADAAGTGTTVAQPGKVEPMLAIVNPEYLAEVEGGKVGRSQS